MGEADSIHFKMRTRGSALSNYDDRIDSRDVLQRIEEIESEYCDTESGELIADAAAWGDDDRAEYDALSRLVAALRAHADYEGHVDDGMYLTRETYWVEYMPELYGELWGRELKEYNPKTFTDETVTFQDLISVAPFNNIDWEAVGEDLRFECGEVGYDGVTYIISL